MATTSWLTALPTTAETAPLAIEQLEKASDRPSTLAGCAREFFAHASPRILLVGLLIIVPARIWFGGWTTWDPLLVLAFALWQPMNEWLTHVFVLHGKPLRLFGRTFDTSLALAHRRHHRDPWRVEYTLLPWQAFSYGTAIHLGVASLILPWPAALTWFASSFAIGLYYEWIHYLTHTSYRPQSAWMKRRTKLHRLHHFKNEQYWHGVTSDFGDWLLRTEPAPRDVPTSELARKLGGVSKG
jgi:hypothetical protein